MAEPRCDRARGVRQQQRHQRLYSDRSEAEADLHRGQSIQETPRASEYPLRRVRGAPDHAAVSRRLAAGARQRTNGPPSLLRPQRLNPTQEVSDLIFAIHLDIIYLQQTIPLNFSMVSYKTVSLT